MIGELSKNFGGGEEDTSFETTLQDLSDIKMDDLVDESFRRGQTYSTIPVQSSSRFPFSPVKSGKRTPSRIRIMAEDKNSDNCESPKTVNFVKVDSVTNKDDHIRLQKQQNQAAPSVSPWGLLSSLFGSHQRNAVGSAGGRDTSGFVFSCDPRGSNVEDFEESDESDDDNLDFMSNPRARSVACSNAGSKQESQTSRKSYALPSSAWRNSLISGSNSFDDSIRRQRTTEDNNNSSPRTPCQKSSHDENVEKIRRQLSLEDLRNNSIPIGRKRTLTDETGRIREEVSL
jgi:hypothetical protein